MRSTSQAAQYVSRPATFLAEGELDPADQPEKAKEQLAQFALTLLQDALRSEGDDAGSAPALTSFSLQWLSGGIGSGGRLYGQAYTEKRGDTIVYLRVKLFNARGVQVASGMATSHVRRRT